MVAFFLIGGGVAMAANPTAATAVTGIKATGDALEAVRRTLDDFHDAAAKADEERYFGHFAKEGVFIGTDATERWAVAEFRAFTHPYFSKGKGWEYKPRHRHVQLAPAGNVAWFDELLDNAKYGECRGTGVLLKEGGKWKIAQYHLTIPLPNALADEVVKRIRDSAKSQEAKPESR